MDPPIQHSKFLSCGAYILIFISFGVIFLASFKSLSGKLVNIVVPPDNTISEKKFFLKSISVLFTEFTNNYGIERHSIPILSGLNRISGARVFS